MSKETIESAASYGIGCGGLLVGLAANAQALTIILACFIVILRLVYDSVRLYRYLRHEG